MGWKRVFLKAARSYEQDAEKVLVQQALGFKIVSEVLGEGAQEGFYFKGC